MFVPAIQLKYLLRCFQLIFFEKVQNYRYQNLISITIVHKLYNIIQIHSEKLNAIEITFSQYYYNFILVMEYQPVY